MIYSKNYFEYDFTFLKEITDLIIINLTTLKEGLATGVKTNDRWPFLKSYNKSKFTLTLLGNENLTAKAEQINDTLKVKSITELDIFLVNAFKNLCNQEIETLHARAKYYKYYISRH